MLTEASLVTGVIYLVVIAIIYWLIAKLGLPEVFLYVFYAVAALILIIWLLGLR